jgi:chorismate synthase
MAGSGYGQIFRITTWGESHGRALGVVIDGVPAGLALEEKDIQVFMDRRKPGQSGFTTARKEGDEARILSGVFEGRTTGTPISIMVENQDQHSKDYSAIAEVFRPGHADYTFWKKYGIRDYRGGGRSSGRETIGRVAAGAVAVKILNQLGISLLTYAKQIGPIAISAVDPQQISRNPFYMPDAAAAAQAEEYVCRQIRKQDSVGGIIECVVSGLPAGLGETVFEKLDANLAKAILSIGAVKGFEIGDGFAAAANKGSENNDAFFMDGSLEKPEIMKTTNHSGGVLGGMSDGSDLIFRAAVKPTPSISRPQDTVDIHGENRTIEIRGRHDPVIVPRAVVVVESMAAITLVDALFTNMSATMNGILEFYQKRK